MVIEFLGIRMYTLGLYTAFGALCAAAVIGVLGSCLGLKRGSALLTALCAAVCGLVCSRLVFAAVYRLSGKAFPLPLWTEGGGWSLAGLLAGFALGGRIAAWAAGERCGTLLDILSCAVLPLIAAERMGEARLSDGHDAAIHTVSAAAALALFAGLLILLVKRREADGRLTAAFLILAGAGAAALESLRKTAFLPVGGMSLLQVTGIIMLAAGTAAVIIRSRRGGRPTPPDSHSIRKGTRNP